MLSKRLSKEKCVDVLCKGGSIRYYIGNNYLGRTFRLYDKDRNQVGHITVDCFYLLNSQLELIERGSTYLYVVYGLK